MVKKAHDPTASAAAPPARGAAKRSHILDVALSLFADRGYEGVSLRAIALAAGVDHPLVKYHFIDKDALWRDAVRLLFERMNAELRGHSFTSFRDDPDRAFSDVIGALVRYNARHPEHARLMVLESVRDSDRIRWAAETFVRRQHAGISPWLEASVKHGFLPDLPRHELVTMLNALCHITFTLAPMVRHSWGVEFGGEASVEPHIDAVLSLLGHRPRRVAARPALEPARSRA